MATIRIRRGSEWMALARAYTVVLDGKEAGRLRRDQEIVLSVGAGAHELYLKIDWCRSNVVSFSLTEGQSMTFECGSNASAWSVLYYIVLRPSHYLWLRQAAQL
jgi:hypothetical protein